MKKCHPLTLYVGRWPEDQEVGETHFVPGFADPQSR